MTEDVPGVGFGERAAMAKTLERLPESAGCDRVFFVLAASRRRYACDHLASRTDGVAEHAELVDAIHGDAVADAEPGAEPSRADVEADFLDVHLPCLAEAGYVDYDPRQGTVRYDPTSLLESWLERLHRTNRSEPGN